MSDRPSPDAGAARDVARTALDGGMAPDLDGGDVGPALPVHHPDGSVESWFVPVTRGDRLAGFVRVTADLRFQAASAFPPGARPAADSWLDSRRVRDMAAGSADGVQVTGEPVLSYDGAPARIAWAVPVRLADGGEATVYVAGASIWQARITTEPETGAH